MARGPRRNSLLSRSFDLSALADDDGEEVEAPPLRLTSLTLPGSFLTSLLTGRFPSPSPPTQFTLLLGVLGCPPRCPPTLIAPQQLRIPFTAIDILEYFNTLHDAPGGSHGVLPSQIRYGYRLIISNQLGTVIKLFLIPYDLLDMQAGEQTFLRQVPEAVKTDPSSDDKNEFGPGTLPEIKESLRYAVQMHFVSSPAHHKRSRSKKVLKPTGGGPPLQGSDDDLSPFPLDIASSSSLETSHHGSVPDPSPPSPLATSDPKIYLSKSIRLVFSSPPPEDDEQMTSAVEEFGVDAFSPIPECDPLFTTIIIW
ncbi:hypothetical protein BS47DRAFT_1344080 [Hydnum rufescens UP504]|uniref:Atos-like conserved domain-containing protein n=1 Tax=Hydnum rufescens UP504 TaxID=1448309 RepID=A0A9P6AZF8_9AGAM|nr:hypothetical protein BS47DRAFT_1344080 [Hydnum rufescens UP504]